MVGTVVLFFFRCAFTKLVIISLEKERRKFALVLNMICQTLMENAVESLVLARLVATRSLSPAHRRPACNFLLVVSTDS